MKKHLDLGELVIYFLSVVSGIVIALMTASMFGYDSILKPSLSEVAQILILLVLMVDLVISYEGLKNWKKMRTGH